jgi:hypothetical protein
MLSQSSAAAADSLSVHVLVCVCCLESHAGKVIVWNGLQPGTCAEASSSGHHRRKAAATASLPARQLETQSASACICSIFSGQERL